MLHGSRWNPKGLAALYGSLELATALAEMLAYYQHQGLPETEALPCVWVGFDIRLDRVPDLRERAHRRKLGATRDQWVNEPWRDLQEQGREALTQAIGRLTAPAGIEGVLVPSARARRGSNLVVFNPAGLAGGRVRIIKEELFPSSRRTKT